MTKKTRCPNCGAYISPKDKTCYVCGERIAPASAPRSTSKNSYAPVVFEPEKDNDFVMPVDHDEAGSVPYEDRKPYSDKDYAEPYYDDNYDQKGSFKDDDVEPYFYDDDYYYDSKGMSTKKIAAICGAVVAGVAVIAVILGFCFANGVFGGGAPAEEITVYFDKPSVNINLMDDNGVVYNWGADVNANYTFNDKEESQSCSPDKEHDNMWKCKIPAGAKDLYFSQTTGDHIRTVNAKVIENDTVYYVTDILLNADDQLPIASCKLSDFDNLGVNASEETESTTVKKKSATKATEEDTEEETEEEETEEEETEKPTELLSNPYNISLPSSWSSGTTKEESGNCVTYYEKYNYKNYGNGMLLSVYTFKPGDNSYGDLNAKKVLTASDGSKVVIVTPSDVEFDDSDEKAMEKYTNLSSQTSQVISSISTN